MYIAGIDCGGTKTHCVIGDKSGKILSEGYGGPANYQVCGTETTKSSIETAVLNALTGIKKVGLIGIDDLSYVVLGMSGADEQKDFYILYELCGKVFKEIPFKIVHDTWIGLRTGVKEGVGIVSICGTGGAHAGRGSNGEMLKLRNINYLLGNREGGAELAEKALHYAFRSNEGTYTKSILEDKVLDIFHMETMDEVCNSMRSTTINQEQLHKLPIAVFEATQVNDPVACELVEELGDTYGRYAACVIKKLKLQNEKLPVVLVGSIFSRQNKKMMDAYKKQILQVATQAYFIIPTMAPAEGAYMMALDQGGLYDQ